MAPGSTSHASAKAAGVMPRSKRSRFISSGRMRLSPSRSGLKSRPARRTTAAIPPQSRGLRPRGYGPAAAEKPLKRFGWMGWGWENNHLDAFPIRCKRRRYLFSQLLGRHLFALTGFSALNKRRPGNGFYHALVHLLPLWWSGCRSKRMPGLPKGPPPAAQGRLRPAPKT